MSKVYLYFFVETEYYHWHVLHQWTPLTWPKYSKYIIYNKRPPVKHCGDNDNISLCYVIKQ